MKRSKLAVVLRAVVLLLWIGVLLCGCAGVTNAIYGPELTPAQLKDAVYQDAYALGAMWAARAPGEKEALLDFAHRVKLSAAPGDLLTQQWLEALRRGDTEHAFIYYAARRLYERVGAKLVAERLTVAELQVDLLVWACDAYIAGVQSL